MSESTHTPKPWHWGSGWQDFDTRPWKNEEFAGPKYADIGLYDGNGKPIIPLRIDHYEIEWDSTNGLADFEPEQRRLIAAAPTNAELAGIGRELAEAVLIVAGFDEHNNRHQREELTADEWERLVELARRVVEAAEPKEE